MISVERRWGKAIMPIQGMEDDMAKEYHTNTAALADWDKICRRVKVGLERIGHDIPIVCYGTKEELRAALAGKKAAG